MRGGRDGGRGDEGRNEKRKRVKKTLQLERRKRRRPLPIEKSEFYFVGRHFSAFFFSLSLSLVSRHAFGGNLEQLPCGRAGGHLLEGFGRLIAFFHLLLLLLNPEEQAILQTSQVLLASPFPLPHEGWI